MRHAVIMAGGVGTRLWPMSRKATPKQFQKLIGNQTLIQQTFDRIAEVIDKDNIWVMTGQDFVELTREQLPAVNPKHIIAEPSARNTAAATGLALLHVLKEDPEAVLFGLLPADHYVGDPKAFAAATTAVFEFIEEEREYVGTIGIYPTEPNSGYGYIKKGSKLAEKQGSELLKVDAFLEKPDQKTAQKFLRSGNYLWNGGYYLFNGARMWAYYQQLQPTMGSQLEDYFKTNQPETYAAIESVAIDKAISEQLDKLVVVSAEMEWSDVGNWATLHDILTSQGDTSEVAENHISSGSDNTLVMGGSKLIATVGLKDVVVIDTDDVILVCHKSHVQDVKKIVEQLEKQGRGELL